MLLFGDVQCLKRELDMVRKIVALAEASDRIQQIGESEDLNECERNCQEALNFIDHQLELGNIDKAQDDVLRKDVYGAVDKWRN